MSKMSKSQIIVLVALGLIACIVLAAAGFVFYTFSASQEVAQATPAPSTPTPEPTATPTITPTPLELPTSAAQAEPTSTNTPVVAATPSPTPGESFGQQLTGHTREPGQAQNNSAANQSPSGTDVRFWADNTSLQAGGCTNLHWQIEGVSAYWIDGQPGAGSTGELHICPSGNETHILKYDESVNGLLRSKELQVSISVSASSASSGSGSSGSSSGGSGSGGGSSGGIVAEFDTANGMTGLKRSLFSPYAIGVTIYDNGDVLVSWAGCGSGAEWTQLNGDKIELKDGSAGQAPYFSISATWDKSGNSVAGETQMLTIDSSSRGVCAIDDAFIMR